MATPSPKSPESIQDAVVFVKATPRLTTPDPQDILTVYASDDEAIVISDDDDAIVVSDDDEPTHTSVNTDNHTSVNTVGQASSSTGLSLLAFMETPQASSKVPRLDSNRKQRNFKSRIATGVQARYNKLQKNKIDWQKLTPEGGRTSKHGHGTRRVTQQQKEAEEQRREAYKLQVAQNVLLATADTMQLDDIDLVGNVDAATALEEFEAALNDSN